MLKNYIFRFDEEKSMKRRTALTIAGSDSSGGAGIQADIKTMIVNGVYAMSAVTALTAQNTMGVTAVEESTPEFLAAQIDAVFTDIRPDAVKIGMVSSGALIRVIAAKLAEYKASLTQEQLGKLVEDTRELKLYQDTPSTPEILAKIPLLSREDIERKAETFSWTEKREDGILVLHHNFFTSGIGYLKVLFRTDAVPQEDLPYVGLLKSVLGSVDTERYGYSDLTSEIHLNSCGLDFAVTSFANLEEPEHFTGAFVASIRVLYDRLDFGFGMIEEILNHSVFTDEKRLGEVIGETRSRARMRLLRAGWVT